jgi:hypothetical protein
MALESPSVICSQKVGPQDDRISTPSVTQVLVPKVTIFQSSVPKVTPDLRPLGAESDTRFETSVPLLTRLDSLSGSLDTSHLGGKMGILAALSAFSLVESTEHDIFTNSPLFSLQIIFIDL